MKFSARDLRNTHMPLLRRLQRKIDVENEDIHFKNKKIDTNNLLIQEQNSLIEQDNLLTEQLFLSKSFDSFSLDGALSKPLAAPVLKPLLPLENKLDYRKKTKLNVFNVKRIGEGRR